ncbi:twin-arginine translocation signal domain-containing protein [Actinomyces sp. W5033]|uniref:twin-arginine translocation signal domain-containing protein n=1 Tax=Actinomyces sp. W5033 TaxID=3446479 RepID=UPI003EE1D278
MTSTRRTFITGAAAAAAAAALGACSHGLPTATPPTATPSHPVLDATRLATVLARVQTGLEAADEAKDATLLAGYLTGPAERVRAQEYALATLAGDDTHIHRFTTEVQAGVVGLTSGFPRTAVVITKPADGEPTYYLTLTQDAAREDYALWSWTRLGDVEVPATPSSSVGAVEVTPEGNPEAGEPSSSLLAQPRDVVEAYLDALNNPDGDSASAFADDALRQRIASDRAIDLSGMGTVTVTAAAHEDGLRGLRTADGGAIFTAALTWTTEYRKTVAGSTLRLGGNVGRMLGASTEIIGTVLARYDAMVSFAVPSASAGGRSTVLGTDAVLAAVERDDSQAPV